MLKRLGTQQLVTLTATAQQTSAFAEPTNRVRVGCGSTAGAIGGAYILFDHSTATTVSSSNGSFIPPSWAEDFDVTPGQRLHTVEYTTSHGTLTVTELS